MFEYKKILFPTDLSEASAKIIPHVKTIAEKFGSEIYLIFVATLPEYYVDAEKPGTHVNKKVKAYKEKYFQEIPDSNIIILGGEAAADEILKYVDSGDIDLVIMPIRGRKALDKAIFGSVSANVARSAPVPVFFINPHRDKFLI